MLQMQSGMLAGNLICLFPQLFCPLSLSSSSIIPESRHLHNSHNKKAEAGVRVEV